MHILTSSMNSQTCNYADLQKGSNSKTARLRLLVYRLFKVSPDLQHTPFLLRDWKPLSMRFSVSQKSPYIYVLPAASLAAITIWI